MSRPASVIQGRFPTGLRLVRPGVAQPQAPGHVQAVGHAQALPPGLIRPNGGGGRPLPEPVRRKMEQAFGTDFSDVRVHVGPQAGAIGALAFTLGSDIHFAPGLYNPDSHQGQHLLGHELAHVVQQRTGRVRNPFGSGVAVVQDPALEAEADRLGLRAASHVVAPGGRAAVGQAVMGAAPGARPGRPLTGVQSGGGVQAKGTDHRLADHRLIVGAYLHPERGLPDAVAGHGFVAVEGPGGKREVWGFSPADRARMDPHRDLGRLAGGVPGEVHRNEAALTKPGVRTRSIPISAEQARTALAKVAEYRSGNVPFSLSRRQCTAFAADVARAAGVELAPGGRAGPPREFYRKI